MRKSQHLSNRNSLDTSTNATCVQELFATQATRTPDTVALVTEDGCLTYCELDRWSNRLAHHLRQLGVGAEVLVGVALDRSAELIVAQLGVLKAGGSYLSLAPSDPPSRLRFMLEDSEIQILMTWGDRLAEDSTPGVRRIDLSTEWSNLKNQSEERLPCCVTPAHRAYVIYTSGSTGRPKGTELVHSGLHSLVSWHQTCYGVGPGERATQVASPAFDASVWEIWPYITAGATLTIPPESTRAEPAALFRFLAEHAITRCFLPTPIAEAMLQEPQPQGLALEVLLVGGDKLHQPPSSDIPFRVVNHYGPTEDTVVSTAGDAAPRAPGNSSGTKPPSIGKPIDKTCTQLVDDSLVPVAPETPGELLVGGPGLARGYLRRPALTAERFVPDPFRGSGERLYRTGDLVSARHDGDIDFLGRIDHQVKVRGFRIELGEIEAVLEEDPTVRTGVVLARRRGREEARLVAYVVPRGDLLTPQLLDSLQQRLPAHMVPTAIIELAELPLTPNGKVDRTALEQLELPAEDLGNEAYEAPRSSTEKAVAKIWQELLGIEKVGIHDHFFAIGGHSLLAGRLVSRLRRDLGFEVPLADIYTAPTIAELTAELGKGDPGEVLPPIELVPRDQPIPLSFPAERVWFLHQLAPGNIAYNANATFRFRGPMRPDIYQRVLTEIVRRHEVFRTRFPIRNGGPVQEIDDSTAVSLPVIDLSRLAAEQREQHAEQLIHEELRRPFEIEDLPLARWSMLRMDANDHTLVQVEFHYVHDGWSFALLLRESKVLYEAYEAGLPSPLPDPPIQYADFSAWQREWMQGEVLERHLAYWTQQLAGSPAALELPTDRPRPKFHSFRGGAPRVELDFEFYERLRQLGRDQGVTLFSTMLAAFKTLLHRYSGSHDILVGTAAANRRTSEIEKMIGMVVNSLVLRTNLAGEPTFGELLQRVQDTWLGAYGFQDMPFDLLVKRLAPDRDLSRNPLFQVMFSFHDSAVPALEFSGLSGDVLERHNGSAKSDINIICIPRAEQRIGSREGISLIWEYATDLFDTTTIERMVEHYKNLLRAAAEDPTRQLSELQSLSVAETHQLLEWNDRQQDRPSSTTLPTLFTRQAILTPDATAVVCGADQISYGELDRRSKALAEVLKQQGVRSTGLTGESLVAVALERSIDLVVSLLAILEAGGAYMPLDATYPAERLTFMLEDAQPALLLSQRQIVDLLPRPLPKGLEQRLLLLEDACDLITGNGSTSSELAHPDGIAYVIYTSGSTGRPKGVQVRHRALGNFLETMARKPGLTCDDTLLAVTTLSFDIAGLELYLPLVTGGTVVVARRHEASDGDRLMELLESCQATAMQATPATWRLLLAAGWQGNSCFKAMCGGEALPPELATALGPRCASLWNLYGPTETTIWSTCQRVDVAAEPLLASRPVAIGRPIDNTVVRLLDRSLRPVAAGIPGDLYLGGDGLARGYLRRPALTAVNFVPDPSPTGPQPRLYRTGDLARRLADGRLEFLGRSDHQVKVRGFRIELGEIESVLEEHPSVKQAAAGVFSASAAGHQLIAHVVAASSAATDEELRNHAASRLPDYMVPSTMLWVDELPLTPNGKVDRRALADRAQSAIAQSRDQATDYVAPSNPVEEILATIWSEVFGLRRIGMNDHFFALGGHSLLATQVVSRLREAFSVELPLRAVFEHPTAGQLAKMVENVRTSGAPKPTPVLPVRREREGLPLSFAQERLWFIDRLIPDRAVYHIARAYACKGPIRVEWLATAVRHVIGRHEILRTHFADVDGRPVQRSGPAPHADAVLLPVIDLSTLDADDRRRECDLRRREEVRHPFDFESGSLQRTTLLRLAPLEHILLLTQHHIISDVWSLAVLTNELTTIYSALARGNNTPSLEALSVQYIDYAVWQRERVRGDTLEEMLAFWRDQLEGAPTVLELPFDRPRPALQTFNGARRWLVVDSELCNKLEDLGRTTGTTPFMVLFSAWAALLGRYAGQDDLVLGTPIAGRQRRETESLVGLFVNTLALRFQLGEGQSFPHLLADTRETMLGAYAQQEMPFERLVGELSPERNLSHSPLFQVLFSLQNLAAESLDFPGLDVSALEVPRQEAHFDLTIFASETEQGLRFLLNYNRDLFDAATIARLGNHFRNLLYAVTVDTQQPFSELPLLAASERHQLLAEWNDTAATYPSELLLHQPFEHHAETSPAAVAVVFEGREVSYGELDRRANQLAWELVDRGVGPSVLVGVHFDRSPEMIVAVLAVHKAGGAYVPLETTWPNDRIRWIIEANGITHCLTEVARRPSIEALAVLEPEQVIDLEQATDQAETAPAVTAGPQDLAYVIFTSGSTGRPKGVMVRHQPAINLVHWVNQRFAVGKDDQLLFVTALSFDLSVYDIFGMLAAGGSIRMASSAEIRDPQILMRILQHEPVTFWDSAPATLQQCLPFFPTPGMAETALRLVFLSGDWIPVSLPDRIRASFDKAEVVSLGGATEAVVWSNYFPVGDIDPFWISIPYGQPISNARYHVLDSILAPCAVGVPGDLFIGEDCLSVGYSAQAKQTARQYLPDPFAQSPGMRLYRTGDRARYLADGNLQFLGRADSQVKVRGFRIELGEIETVLTEQPGVSEAVVVVRQDTPENQRLVAYFIPKGSQTPSAAALRASLAEKLTEYMLPVAFLALAEWPLASTGKLDRKALPTPEAWRAAQEAVLAAPETDLATSKASPLDSLEKRIASLWCDLLDIEQIGPDDNFFDLGGHSLLMAQCHARLQRMLSRELLMVDLFRFPTVTSLAHFLDPEASRTTKDGMESVATGRVSADTVSLEASREIAIVGMAGRFPGANDIEQFWSNLAAGVESIRFFSDDELLAAGLDPQLLSESRYVKARGALEQAEAFDAAFFGMSPRQAEVTDPQQRAFLECAWHALEHAGYDPHTYDQRIGVYGGVSLNRYLEALLADSKLVETVGRGQILLGNQHDYLATQLSYKLDLRGPSINVQSACSTSLLAIHLACMSLRHGDCEMALAGGATINAGEVKGYFYEEGGIDSPDGHTRAFDAAARGVVNGSGVGIVVLKRLEDALAEGDTVHAVIRGSASNNDGGRGKAGFTAPSVEGQSLTIREAQRLAAVAPETVGYVEGHGTGTPVGDPIEVAALTQAFRSGTEKRGFCALGSVKTNIGHLDAAAGVAGLIKTVLALKHQQIPPSLHFQAPNPEIDLGRSPFYVNTSLTPWPVNDSPRRAGVSSFGIGGTNVHLVLEEAPASPPVTESRPAQLLLLSAKTPTALAAAATNLGNHLQNLEGVELADVAYTLGVGRRAFDERRFVVCRDSGTATTSLTESHSSRRAEAKVTPIFMFPGQGSQYAGMGAELYRHEPTFRASVDECCDLIQPKLGTDLRRLLFPIGGGTEEDDLEFEQTAIAQPALFIVELSLARLWMEWGVQPAAMIGHSLGEIVAACLAGVVSLNDALRLVVRRGQLMEEMQAGDMLAVGLSEKETRDWLSSEGTHLSLAAVNSPAACVVAGEVETLCALRQKLGERNIEAKQLHTSHAFHSRMMEPMVARFTSEVANVELRPPKIPYVSNVTGGWITAAQATDPGYWGDHLRQTVRFADGMTKILEVPNRVLVEIGPGRQLCTLARQHSTKTNIQAAVTTLPHPQDRGDDYTTLLTAAGKLWTAGAAIDWSAFWAGERRQRVPLPLYPFERKRYWPKTLPQTIAPGFSAAQPPPPSTVALGESSDPQQLSPTSPWDAQLTPTQQAVAEIWQGMLGVDQVAVHDDFFDLGGSSLMALQLAAGLRRAMGIELPASFLLQAPTLGALAELVDQAAGSGGKIESSCLIRLQTGVGRPLFMVHQVGGHAYTFRALARELGPSQPLYALRSLGLEEGEKPLRSIADMATQYLELIRGVAPRGPYLLGGASMGGMVAFEMARQLEADGEQVALLTLMDTPCLDQMPLREGHAEAVAAAFPVRLPIPIDELRTVADEEQIDYATAVASREGTLPATFDASEVRRHAAVILANMEALYEYTPRPYDGSLLYFRARERRAGDPPRPELPWIELAESGVETIRVQGNHMTMHELPNLSDMAQHLRLAITLRQEPPALARRPARRNESATVDCAEVPQPMAAEGVLT